MLSRIDLNSDVGESFGRYKLGFDERLMACISSANVACGMHAGDPSVMRRTVEKALSLGVKVGAHPSYPDLQGFGRRTLDMGPDEVYEFTLYQMGALDAFLRARGSKLTHVKPHGALYNDVYKRALKGDRTYCEAIASAVKDFDPSLWVVTLAGNVTMEIYASLGLKVAGEVFADRAYNPDGSLVPRGVKGAVIEDVEAVVERVVRMVERGEVEAMDGSAIKGLSFHTICLHGDSEGAVEMAERIRKALSERGISIKSFAEP